jgi:hypothetical protein
MQEGALTQASLQSAASFCRPCDTAGGISARNNEPSAALYLYRSKEIVTLDAFVEEVTREQEQIPRLCSRATGIICVDQNQSRHTLTTNANLINSSEYTHRAAGMVSRSGQTARKQRNAKKKSKISERTVSHTVHCTEQSCVIQRQPDASLCSR